MRRPSESAGWGGRIGAAVAGVGVHRSRTPGARLDVRRPFSHFPRRCRLRGVVSCVWRRRYYNHLNPVINKGPWTFEEDQIIIVRQIEFPNKWANVAREVNGR